MERLVQRQEIPKVFEEKDLMSKKRANLVWLILTDKPYSWSLKVHLEEKATIEFLKKNKNLFAQEDEQQ